jgi:hypothetical protein
MGNWADLYTLDSPTPRERLMPKRRAAFSVTAKYHVPPLWLALYSPGDLRMCQESPGADAEVVPHLVCESSVALARLLSRADQLAAVFSEAARPVVADFHHELADAAQPFVHLETQDVGTMSRGNEAWAEDLAVMLSAFEDNPSSPAPAGQKSGLSDEARSPGWQRYFSFFEKPPDGDTLAEYLAGDF